MPKVVPIVPSSSTVESNTSTVEKGKKKKQISPAKFWTFTLLNYTKEHIVLIEKICSSKVPKIEYVFGEEICPTTKTPHLQGFIRLAKKERASSLGFPESTHFEKCYAGKDANCKYTSKDGKVYTNMKFDKPLKLIEESAFYPYQKWLVKKFEQEPDDRTIIWIWDKKGSIGKSQFAKWLAAKKGACMLSGKASNIYNGVVKFKEAYEVYPTICVVDIPRDDKDNVMPYGAIEAVKNGLFFSGKYESAQVLFNSPHVVVFANERPDVFKYSADRWIIREIKNVHDPISD